MEKRSNYNRMTDMNVCKLIIILGIPTTISMLITNVYNIADTYFVGTLGVSQQGATSVLFTLQCIIQAIAFMLGHGSGTYVAKCLADNDKEEGSRYVSTAFFTGLAFGTLLLIFGLIFLEPFMYLLQSTDTILPYAKQYGMWVLISAPFMVASLILNNNLRYEGKAIFAMVGLGLGGILNIFGDFLFISVMNLGVFGAGMSTGISQIISFIVLLILYFKFGSCKLSFKYISRKFVVYYEIFKGGLPSLLRQGLAAISNGVLNGLAKEYGDAIVASMGVVNRFSSLVMCVGMGIGQGFQPMSAYNYRQKRYSRVKKGVLFTIGFGTLLVLLLSLAGLIIPREIITILQSGKKEVDYEFGEFALRWASIGVLAMPISVTTNMLFQSIRKSWTASFLALLRSGLVFIPVVYLFNLWWAKTGIALAQPVSDAISTLICLPFLLVFLLKKEKQPENVKND